MEMQEGWSFVRTRSGGWIWKHAARPGDAVAAHSSRTFKTLPECIADATVHGYNPKTQAERGTLFR